MFFANSRIVIGYVRGTIKTTLYQLALKFKKIELLFYSVAVIKYMNKTIIIITIVNFVFEILNINNINVRSVIGIEMF